MPDRIDRGLDSSLALIMPPLRQRRLMFAIAICVLAVGVVASPFGAKKVTPVHSFVAVTESLIFMCDLFTAYLLLTHSRIIASASLLALGSGYLFSALIVVPHALSFPGAFAPSGLLNGGLQGTGWLYIFWHLGLPVSVIAYAFLDGKHYLINRATFYYTVTGVAALAFILVVLSTRVPDSLPPLFIDSIGFTSFANYVTGIDLAIAVLALFALSSRGTKSLIAGWATVAMIALVAELAVVTFIIGGRFTVGFYIGRSLSLVVSLVVLIALLGQIVGQDVRLARMNLAMQLERRRRLMTVDAALSAIAHELKQPLTAISANAEAAQLVLENELERNASGLQEIIDDISSDVLRANAAIGGIRDLFRPALSETGSLNVNEIAAQVLRIFRDRIHQHSVVLDAQLDSSLPPIIGNKAQLQEVIFNVIQNALDAVENVSAEARRVSVRTEWRGANGIVMSIEDSGPGIAEDQLAQIFDAFVTTKQNGMGMGLAICRTIVERHGGDLRASCHNKRTRFDIVLPTPSIAAPGRAHQPAHRNDPFESLAFDVN